jgi:hypothetical protein
VVDLAVGNDGHTPKSWNAYPRRFAKPPAVKFEPLTGGPKCIYHRRNRPIRRG